MILLNNSWTSVLLLGGAAVPGSERWVDMQFAQAARVQYQTTNANITVRPEYSLDNGGSWSPLLGDDPAPVGANPYVVPWQPIPEEAKADCMVRAFALGTGVLTTVTFVELSVRAQAAPGGA